MQAILLMLYLIMSGQPVKGMMTDSMNRSHYVTITEGMTDRAIKG